MSMYICQNKLQLQNFVIEAFHFSNLDITLFQVDFFNKDLERFERKVTTPELLQNEKQIKEDLEFLNSLREESLRRKFESQVTATTTKN